VPVYASNFLSMTSKYSSSNAMNLLPLPPGGSSEAEVLEQEPGGKEDQKCQQQERSAE
jgi:hypothetical protein